MCDSYVGVVCAGQSTSHDSIFTNRAGASRVVSRYDNSISIVIVTASHLTFTRLAAKSSKFTA